MLSKSIFKSKRFDYIFKDTLEIEEAQVVQKELGSIVIRIIKRSGYNDKIVEEIIRKSVANKISSTLEVKFEYPNLIEREATGKFRAVKSYI